MNSLVPHVHLESRSHHWLQFAVDATRLYCTMVLVRWQRSAISGREPRAEKPLGAQLRYHQVRDPRGVEAQQAWGARDPQHCSVAARAAENDAHAVAVLEQCSDLARCPASYARRDRGRHLLREDLTQGSRSGVPIQAQLFDL